eukprot:jgi/Picsp_1/721/NSC_04210-R1_anamorsin homolog 1-like
MGSMAQRPSPEQEALPLLVITTEPKIHFKQIEYAVRGMDGAEAGNAVVMTCGNGIDSQDGTEGVFERIVCLGFYADREKDTVKKERSSFLGKLMKRLVPGGKLRVVETWQDGTDGRVVGEDGDAGGDAVVRVVVDAEKLPYERKAKAAIRLEGNGVKTWKVASSEEQQGGPAMLGNDDDDDDLLDEDDLLLDEDVARPDVPVGEDLREGGKKACANCTCGRAEGKERKLTKDMIENPTSGCGSCALGDAFRCAGCPYRGLPAFEMGKKIELPPDFLVDDLQ